MSQAQSKVSGLREWDNLYGQFYPSPLNEMPGLRVLIEQCSGREEAEADGALREAGTGKHLVTLPAGVPLSMNRQADFRCYLIFQGK